MSYQRKRIYRHVVTHPGEHFNGLARALDLAPGQVQYHLQRLERQDRVVAERVYGRTHYYPTTYDEDQRRSIAVLQRETARDVLFYLLEHGPTSPGIVADEIGIARSTLEWHLDHLLEQDLVCKRREEGNRVTLVVREPTEVLGLLQDVTPKLPQRLVDRFGRLVDSLLDE